MTMLVSGIGALLGGGGAAAGAGAAGTAAAGATAAATSAGLFGSGISASTILSGMAGFASAIAGLKGADAQSQQYDMQADVAAMQAVDEEIKGVQRTSTIKQQLAKALGENAIKFAAAGQLVGEGAAQDNAGALDQKATTDITVDRADTDARSAVLRARAAGYRRIAGSSKRAGRTGFFANIASSFS